MAILTYFIQLAYWFMILSFHGGSMKVNDLFGFIFVLIGLVFIGILYASHLNVGKSFCFVFVISLFKRNGKFFRMIDFMNWSNLWNHNGSTAHSYHFLCLIKLNQLSLNRYSNDLSSLSFFSFSPKQSPLWIGNVNTSNSLCPTVRIKTQTKQNKLPLPLVFVGLSVLQFNVRCRFLLFLLARFPFIHVQLSRNLFFFPSFFWLFD